MSAPTGWSASSEGRKSNVPRIAAAQLVAKIRRRNPARPGIGPAQSSEGSGSFASREGDRVRVSRQRCESADGGVGSSYAWFLSRLMFRSLYEATS